MPPLHTSEQINEREGELLDFLVPIGFYSIFSILRKSIVLNRASEPEISDPAPDARSYQRLSVLSGNRQPVSSLLAVKERAHPKIINLSSFTHSQCVPNLYDFLSSVEHVRYVEEC